MRDETMQLASNWKAPLIYSYLFGADKITRLDPRSRKWSNSGRRVGVSSALAAAPPRALVRVAGYPNLAL